MVGTEKGRIVKTKTAYTAYRGSCKNPPPHWDDLEQWMRDALEGTVKLVKYLSGTSDGTLT